MTLMQGALNTFVVFRARVIAFAVDSFISKGAERNGPSWVFTIVSLVLDVLLGFLAGMIVAWVSRQRAFKADRGAADLMGHSKPMINALARLGGMTPGQLPQGMQALGITSGVGKLFSTHPPIEERIEALRCILAIAFFAIGQTRRAES